MSGLLGHYEDSDEDDDAPSALAAQEAAASKGEAPAADSTGGAAKGASPPAASPAADGAEAGQRVPSASPPIVASDGAESSDDEDSGAKADGGEDMLLPPSPDGQPDAEILERVKSLHDLRKRGKSIRDHIQASRDWSNPYILERVVKVFELEQYGSNFPKEIFDPSRVAEHPSDWYDAPEVERPPPPKRPKKEKDRSGLSRTKSSSGLSGADNAVTTVVS
eukprot:TRINITY_DN108251_c0_g1_i1.p1 TRINITY_DN108251_c0_g1~~TRINITY_DN108251_c0_g1_i1.p1  ORF type:complete len:232 (-),score=46.11 TRINITY_DN108251_c0_g1_i1:41-703(-)